MTAALASVATLAKILGHRCVTMRQSPAGKVWATAKGRMSPHPIQLGS